MCSSFFGLGDKIDAKIDDFVRKFEDRLADIEDKQDSDYESNKNKFANFEVKIDDLNNKLIEQEDRFKKEIESLRMIFNDSEKKHKEMQSSLENLNMLLKDLRSENKDLKSQNDRLASIESDIIELKEKTHQQSGKEIL